MATILLADDHGFVRAAFKRLINEADKLTVIAEAATGESAVIKYKELRPDIVVMDLAMPGIGGLEAIRKIRTHDGQSKIVVLTAYTEALQLKRVLAAGAQGVLSKNCRPAVFFEAIDTVLAGRPYMEQLLAQTLALSVFNGGTDPLDELNDREFEITRLLASGKPAKEVARILNLSPKTISTYQSHIYGKLGVSNLASLTRLAIKLGIIDCRP